MMEDKNISRDLNIAAAQFVKEKEYWTNQLAGEPEAGYFPYDTGKSTGQQPRREVMPFEMDRELFERIKHISAGSFPKIHMILVAGTAALLARYTGARDIIVGTPIDKQDTEDALINTILPLRVRLTADMTFKELLLEVRKVINQAIENQNFPIDTLIAKSEEHQLLDVMAVLENIQDRKYVSHLQPGIMFIFRWTTTGIAGEVEYKGDCYGKESIERIIRYYLRLMRGALFDVNQEINTIELLSREDRDGLTRFNDTRAQYPHQKTIHRLFALQVENSPGDIALVEAKSGSTISYRQLDERADNWAKFLLKQGDKRPGIIGIMAEPSPEQVCAVLAVLKSGCAYLPIDIDYPGERKLYMLQDSDVHLLLTQKGQAETLAWPGKILYIEDMDTLAARADGPWVQPPPVQPGDPAYVIYTSGSTGKPKGVVVEHRSLVNYIYWAAKVYVKNEKVNFPFYTSLAFDLTVTSLFTPLLTGSTIFIYTGENKEFLVEKIFNENKVEVVKLTPLHLMLESNRPGNHLKIKRFIVGGEQLDAQLAKKIHDNFNGNVEIYNEYGPTEATVGCMIYRYDPQTDTGGSVPIGSPAHNVQIYLLDRYMREVPPGGTGEIYIGGDSLARGYLNNPELTAEKFKRTVIRHSSFVIGSSKRIYKSTNERSTNDRLYKTGDMARKLGNGNIEFLGRKDQQVKVRGYRIETAEVESFLLKHEHIYQAVVLAKKNKNGYNYLIAYVIPTKTMGQARPDEHGTHDEREMNIDTGQLRDYLLKYLPEFMIPSYFVPVDQLPLTPNGKLDRKLLAALDGHVVAKQDNYSPPTNELEKTMVAIWQDVMGAERVGIDDSYFSLGGDSIKAIQISARLQKFKLKMELRDLFRYATIREVTPHVKPLKKIPTQGIIEGEVELTPIQHWFFEKNFSREHHFNQSVMLYREQGLNEEIIKKVFYQLMKLHDALRIIFKREGGKIRQVNQSLAAGRDLVDMEVFEIPGDNDDKQLEEITREKCSRIQRSIDLAGGPLVKSGLFKTIRGDYLLIAIHHLVFDGLSWRILFEDFASLYQQIENGIPEENWQIPLKTTSYKEWAEKLYEYSNNSELLKERDYWQNIEKARIMPLFKNKRNIKGKGRDARQLSFELSEEYTEKLLKQTNKAYNTEINDILLTALGLAVNHWTSVKEVPVILEGHGREEIIPGIDITRTVGWFTTVYPVILDMRKNHELSILIKNTKEMLRNIPCKGIGYGILKYLTKEENKQGIKYRLNPEISFNYLGQFDEDIDTDFFHSANISPGESISLNLERIYTFYILGIIFRKKLTMSVNYNMNIYDEKEIRLLVNEYKKQLEQIIDHCAARGKTELTLSDFSADIDEQEVETVFDILKGIGEEG